MMKLLQRLFVYQCALYRCLLPVVMAAQFGAACTLVAADCAWGAPVVAWVDEDRDGIQDPAEPPLEGVRFQVNDTRNHHSDVGMRAVTDWNGSADLLVWLPGCPRARFEVVSQPPPGYVSLTSEPLQISGSGYGDQTTLTFPYERLPGISTPTPHVARLACQTYQLGASRFDVSPSGDLWAVTWDGAAKYDHVTDTWDLYPFDGAELSLFEGIEIAPTGEVIIRAYNGVATMTDHAWAVTPLDADVSFGLAPAIGSSPNGDIWFYVPAPPDMIALFKPRSGQWTYFGPDSRSTDANLRVTLTEHLGIQYAFFNTARNDGFDGTQPPAGWSLVDRHEFSNSEFREITLRGWIKDATMCLDGTVWISHSFGISSLNPSTEEWRYYDPSEALGFLPQIGSITCSSTGEVWVAAEEAHPLLIRLDPPAERGALPTWTIYDPRDGLPDEESLQGVYVDREGAVWIGYGSSHITARCSLR